jgi:TRAP-type C4-dicarboxylate transport system permease small subunit
MQNLTEKISGPGPGFLKIVFSVMQFLITAAGCIMALTFFFVVILRYGFNADLFAYEEWLMVIAFWMFFLASAVATHNNSHITADILGIFLKNSKTIWLRSVLVKSFELFILLYLTYLGYVMISEEIAAYPMWQKSIALKIPFLVPRLGIAFGFLMMTIYTILFLYLLVKEGPSSLEDDDKQAIVEC